MKTLERYIENKVVWAAKDKLGVKGIKLNTLSERGWPDRLFLIPGGRPLFIEFKRFGGELSKRQELIISRLKADNYNVEVHDDFESAFQAIARAVAAARVPEEGHQVAPSARLRRTASRPGPGKD